MTVYYPLNSFRICIDKKTFDDFNYRVYCPLEKNEMIFNDLTKVILKLDELFDLNNYPKSYQMRRVFNDANEQRKTIDAVVRYDIEDLLNHAGNINTFDIIVNSRQHSNWQGFVKDKIGVIVYSYNSDMELINFLQKATI